MSIDLRPGATALEEPKPVPMAAEVASRWTAIGSALTQTQAVQNASIPPESWTGVAADAASAEIQKLGGKLSDLSAAFPGPASALNTWDERNTQGIKRVRHLQQQWDEAIAVYKRRMAEIAARAAADKEEARLHPLRKYGPQRRQSAPETQHPATVFSRQLRLPRDRK